MTYEEIIKYVGSLSDSEVIELSQKAYDDLMAAAPETEWLESCFAGLTVFCDEMGRRGLKTNSLHNT